MTRYDIEKLQRQESPVSKESLDASSAACWQAEVLTLFPEMFPGPLGFSILGRALDQGLWSLKTTNPRDFATDSYQSVDDEAFGGGPGMVMKPDVLDRALLSIFPEGKPGENESLIYLSPRGYPLTQKRVQKLATRTKAVMICGRFEGVDQRLIDHWKIDEISIGDYVLAGGEIAAMTLIEACVRLRPGVLGSEASLGEESFSDGLLEYPQYTRPRHWKGGDVPPVLLSGHHGKIKAWRREQSEKLTKTRRPDLWKKYLELVEKG